MNVFRDNLVKTVTEIILNNGFMVPDYTILYDELKVYQLANTKKHISGLENNIYLSKILYGHILAQKILNNKITWINTKIYIMKK
jgi:hypothetical protein